jgi:GntR family carbon starvation induced transcriptional regulator
MTSTTDARPAPTTRTQWVDERLREAILAGELPPGTPLRAEELAERWSVSPTPVREALRRLTGVGFVEWQPQRGARVAAATLRDVEEVYELRLLLEPTALRASLGRADDDLRTEIGVAYSGYEAAMEAGTGLGEVFAAHRRFHAVLLSRCPNERMLGIIDGLAEHAQRFQVLALGAPHGHHDVIAEHRTLRDHALAGRVEAAAEFLRAHLDATRAGVADTA